MMTISQGSTYGVAQRRWVAKQGVEETASSRFVGALFHSLTDNCKAEDHGFDHILGAFRG
jgi:hypothetical protein